MNEWCRHLCKTVKSPPQLSLLLLVEVPKILFLDICRYLLIYAYPWDRKYLTPLAAYHLTED